jgi:hypothetical protein
MGTSRARVPKPAGIGRKCLLSERGEPREQSAADPHGYRRSRAQAAGQGASSGHQKVGVRIPAPQPHEALPPRRKTLFSSNTFPRAASGATRGAHRRREEECSSRPSSSLACSPWYSP